MKLMLRTESGGISFWFAWVAALLAAGVIAPWFSSPPTPPPGQPAPTAQNVWRFLQATAPKYGVDARFAYTLAVGESGLDPYAFNHGARGLMQMRPEAWAAVSNEPFHVAWDWEKNTRAALAYLASCRDELAKHGAVSPALLAASYHFGPDAVAAAGYELRNLPRAPNDVYRKIFKGDLYPVAAPDPSSPAS
jgi:hypothetical protein